MEITVIDKDPTHVDDQSLHEEGTPGWGENADVSIKKVALGYDQYIPYIVDLYGNMHCVPATVVYFDGLKSILHTPSAK